MGNRAATFGLALGTTLALVPSSTRQPWTISCQTRPAETSGSSAAEPKVKVLHLSWMAFFITFMVWCNHAPLMAAIRNTFALSKEQVATLLIMDLALTFPARIVVSILLD